MAAAAILKAIGHFRFYIFDFDRKSQNYFSNFIGIGRKLTQLLQFAFFHNVGYRHLGIDDR
jgi:sigma54-dependent transcription regulator